MNRVSNLQLKLRVQFSLSKQAHEITWGRGMGCDFAKKSCKELMEDKVMQYPFCNDIMSRFNNLVLDIKNN